MGNFDQELSDIYPWLLRMARRYCYSMQDAEDLVGDTVYKVLLNRDRFDLSKDIKSWCLIVMRNTYITSYNRSSLVHFAEYDIIAENRSVGNPYNMIIYNDIMAAIMRCSQKSRCIDSVIYWARGYSYDEISNLLHVPVGTVKSRISFGRKILHQELGY